MKSPKTTAKTTTKKTAPKAKKTDKPIKVEATKATQKKPVPKKKASKKTTAEASKTVVATEEKTISDRIGSTAGSIWHYLAEHDTATVAQLLREIKEDEKIIQRSIGWLAQEGKITLGTTSKGESITLKD